MEMILLTIVETAAYLADAKGVLTDEDRVAIVNKIAADPECGKVIVGSGGVRKVRHAIGNKGKSGGVRVIYAYKDERFPAFILTVFAKNERSNLSAAEVNILAKFVKTLFDKYGA